MDNPMIEELAAKVQANPKYQKIADDFVRRLCGEALAKGLTGKSAVKYVRNKLHQVGNAYFKQRINVNQLQSELSSFPQDSTNDFVKSFCIKTMKTHASTAERLPILEQFFYTCLEPIAPIDSVLDMACGMNPFAIPWMPLAKDFRYVACDIYLDMLALSNAFFSHFNFKAHAQACDLLGTIPQSEAQVTFLLKSIPCLEQVDKSIGTHLLESIPSKHILISFPARSLSGKIKGMPDFYRQHFYALIRDKTWEVQEFEFSTELAFLVTK
jgi:16S rRNA (guanine(1405)-N(7))-methyltransferase